MVIEFRKHSGAGNDFIMIDNRTKTYNLSEQQIHALCRRQTGIGADGLILLESSSQAAFKMVYYNADGRLGSMCGNGGRCTVRFAWDLKLIGNNEKIMFEANDDTYEAQVVDEKKIVLKMQPPFDFIEHLSVEGYDCSFINTGSPHAVLFEDNIQEIDVCAIGKTIRHAYSHFKQGTNVNFVQMHTKESIRVRTFERGVEDETLACGTGVVAAAIVSHKLGKTQSNVLNVTVQSGDSLQVSFDEDFSNVFLAGPAFETFKGEINL